MARISSLFIYFIVLLFAVSSCNSGQSNAVNSESEDKKHQQKLFNQIEEGGNAEFYFRRGELNYNAGSYDAAIADLEKTVAMDTLKPQYFHLLSDAYMDYYRSKDALILMHRTAKRFPNRIPTLLKLAEIQLIVKLNEASLETVAKIFQLEPDNPDGHFMKGMNFRAMGETDRAINAFQTATELNPEMIDAWLIAGDLLFEKGLPIALDYYDAALAIDSDNISALHSKAYFLQNNNQDEKAIAIYRDIALLDKNYLDAYLNSGILYLSKDSLDSALEQFNIMASIKPENHLPYFYRGIIYERQGHISAARKEFQNCINLKDDFVRARKALNNLNAS